MNFLSRLFDRHVFPLLERLADAIDRAIGVEDEDEPPESVVVLCPCKQRNRVRRSDFNRGPICGKCRRMLRLPS